MQRTLDPASFLGTLNRLSGTANARPADGEQVKRMVLQRLQQGPAALTDLAELSLPLSAVQASVTELRDLGLVEPAADGQTVRLSNYAEKALTYFTPA